MHFTGEIIWLHPLDSDLRSSCFRFLKFPASQTQQSLSTNKNSALTCAKVSPGTFARRLSYLSEKHSLLLTSPTPQPSPPGVRRLQTRSPPIPSLRPCWARAQYPRAWPRRQMCVSADVQMSLGVQSAHGGEARAARDTVSVISASLSGWVAGSAVTT